VAEDLTRGSIIAASISVGFDCCASGWLAGAALALDGGSDSSSRRSSRPWWRGGTRRQVSKPWFPLKMDVEDQVRLLRF
jgi:hypothetical protein